MRRRLRLVSLAILGLAACRPGEPPTTPSPGGLPSTEPHVRIGITVDSVAALISAPASFEIAVAGGATLARAQAGESWVFTADGSGRLRGAGPDGRLVGPVDGLIRVAASNDRITIGGRPFHGEALVRAAGPDRVTAINVVELEGYLLGVVPRELGQRPADEIEAVKAQAVAARTYALSNLGGRAASGFDFYATVLDQVYGGMAVEDPVSTRAVHETRGEIVTYQGRPIQAYYSSTCGGRTSAIEDSWPWREPVPYLRSVSDRIPGTDEYYCGGSSRFRWTTRWTREQLLDVLGSTLASFAGKRTLEVSAVNAIDVVATNRSRRVTIQVVADGTPFVLRDDSVRWVLRPPGSTGILNSSRIDSVAIASANGQVTGLEIRGGGWGHGIGMCQVGAMGRARAGQSYEEILDAYYTDTEITRLY